MQVIHRIFSGIIIFLAFTRISSAQRVLTLED